MYKAISDKLEKRNLRRQITEACKVETPTFYAWLLRGKIPFLAQKEISNILQLPQSELFPEKVRETNSI